MLTRVADRSCQGSPVLAPQPDTAGLSHRGTEHMRTYLQISGVVFGVIALLHVFRLLLGWPAQIAGWAVPSWISWVAILAAGALSLWAFRLLGQVRPSS